MTDLDPLLRDTMASLRRPIDARPSLSDVRRRARRRNRRRMAMTAGVVACTGVATTALIIRRDSLDPAATGQSEAGDAALPSTTWQPDFSTTTVLGISTATVDSRMVWAALAAVGIEPADDTAAGVMPTPEQFGCTTTECRAMFTYVVWHEIVRHLGWADLGSFQSVNPAIDFSVPPVDGAVLQLAGYAAFPTTVPGTFSMTTTTGVNGEHSLVVLIDAGAPEGAMDDARIRLSSAFDIDVVSPVAPWDHSAVIPVNADQPFAYEIGPMLGIDVVSSDPSLLATLSPDAIAAIVIGPDYWDLVGQAPVPTAAPPTSTSSTISATTTSIAG